MPVIGIFPAMEQGRDSLQIFRCVALAAAATELIHSWLTGWLGGQQPGALAALLALVALLCAAAAFSSRYARLAAAVAAGVVAGDVASHFANHANHHLLLALGLAISALPRDDRSAGGAAERADALWALRWLPVIGFAWAGIQKLVYGFWFGGELLAFAAAQRDSFALVLEPLFPDGELSRLRAIPLSPGAGPFRTESPWVAALANLSVLAELALAPLLAWSRTRAVAAVGALVFLLGVEIAAREVFFGLLMAALVLLHLPDRALERALPLFWLAYAVLLATTVGLLPAWSFT